MRTLTPYLFFNGNCREAMNFYKECFGGNIEVMTYADGPPDVCPDNPKDQSKVMHAYLSKGTLSLMASDDIKENVVTGSNVQITVECETPEETDQLFERLQKGGTVEMALENTFWNARFGAVKDKFGIHWMLNCPLEK